MCQTSCIMNMQVSPNEWTAKQYQINKYMNMHIISKITYLLLISVSLLEVGQLVDCKLGKEFLTAAEYSLPDGKWNSWLGQDRSELVGGESFEGLKWDCKKRQKIWLDITCKWNKQTNLQVSICTFLKKFKAYITLLNLTLGSWEGWGNTFLWRLCLALPSLNINSL